MDIYNLINSKAISNHCRKIKHKFNTEELAVLIYRNKTMNTDEKIAAYKELIIDYPDMEVIKRINCKHYDSVKVMIEQEIKRIQDLIKKLEKKEDAIYTYNYYCNSRYSGIIEGKDEYKDIYKTFEEVKSAINNEIKEDDEKEIISFAIRKRSIRSNIRAEYKINENRKIELINIYDFESEWLDISNICLNIPTPFKKGDILVSTSKTPFAEGYILDYDGYPFVLSYLCTWNKDFQNKLDTGNFDSSDMQGGGYYISESNIILDNNHDYDSFEYFEGTLEGMERILKAISSLLKGDIEISLFINAYEKMKEEYNSYLNNFTDDGLRLCGFSDEDIEKMK